MTLDNIYINTIITHDDLTYTVNGGLTIATNDIPTISGYDTTKNIPIITDPSKYYASIIRFDIPLQNVPLYIMPIVPNQGNPNLTPFIIGINYNNTFYGGNLIYVPQNNLPAPSQLGFSKQVITGYYFVYSYQVLINMINTALINAYTASGLQTLIGSTFIPPYLYYESNEDLIHIVVPRPFTSITSPLITIPKIYMNITLGVYLDGFNYYFNGNNAVNGAELVLTINNPAPPNNYAYALNNGTPSTPPSYYNIPQENPSLQSWTALKKIIISTSSLPFNSENKPIPDNVNPGFSINFPIISDFTPSIEVSNNIRTAAYYYPTSQYRLIDILSQNPIYRFDFKLHWEDVNGNLYPIYIPYNQSANIKLAFLSKKLYEGSGLLKI